ncbi:hypothetical protein LDENG_00181070 [Lucifuga dentata]|nr:hypothetical protein LDENG_00181070 [Lucifuga dentata]
MLCSQTSELRFFRFLTWKNALERHLKSELRLGNPNKMIYPDLPSMTSSTWQHHGSELCEWK